MPLIALMVVVLLSAWLWENHPGAVILIGVLAVAGIILIVVKDAKYKTLLKKMSPEERAAHLQARYQKNALRFYGPVSAQLICPHCNSTCTVRSKNVQRQTTAVTGSFAKVKTVSTRLVTQRHCDNCHTTWDV